jgi:hypothetical protein
MTQEPRDNPPAPSNCPSCHGQREWSGIPGRATCYFCGLDAYDSELFTAQEPRAKSTRTRDQDTGPDTGPEVAILDAADSKGGPYVVPCWHNGERVPLTYAMALTVARSAHPSRVLANTNVYRYGRFTECPPDGTHDGMVTVTMFGQHIATFTPDHVQLWSRGYVTVSTTEALGNLCDAAWFYTMAGTIYVRDYGLHDGADKLFTEGMTFPYRV